MKRMPGGLDVLRACIELRNQLPDISPQILGRRFIGTFHVAEEEKMTMRSRKTASIIIIPEETIRKVPITSLYGGGQRFAYQKA